MLSNHTAVYIDGEICYRGKTFHDKYVYGEVFSIEDKIFIDAKRVFPDSIVGSVPGIATMNNEYIFPDDLLDMVYIDVNGNEAKVIESLKVVADEDDYLLISNDGQIKMSIYSPIKDNKIPLEIAFRHSEI